MNARSYFVVIPNESSFHVAAIRSNKAIMVQYNSLLSFTKVESGVYSASIKLNQCWGSEH